MKNTQTEGSIALAKDQFSFAVYRKDSDGATEPSWNEMDIQQWWLQLGRNRQE